MLRSSYNKNYFLRKKYSSIVNILSNNSSSITYDSDPAKLKSKYDVVIIGAGHNGLVAANYLAKFSKKKLSICLLEKRNCIGGAAVTEELVPGFKFSRASYLLSLFRPIIINDLDLMRHGMLKFYTRDPSSYTPLIETDPQYSVNRTSLTLSSDSDFNRKQIAKFSQLDSINYEKYEHWLNNICEILEPSLDLSPPSYQTFSNKNLIGKIKYLKSYLKDYKTSKKLISQSEDIYRLFAEPAANLLDEWFESDVLKATLATDSVIGAMLSPYSVGSAYVLLHHIIGGIDGKKGVWAYVEGGMGSISKCLAHNARVSFNDQIDIFLSQNVTSIELDDPNKNSPKAKGVLLDNGKFIECDYLLTNCTPHISFTNLLSKYNLTAHNNKDIANYFKRIEKISYESGTMKISKLFDFL